MRRRTDTAPFYFLVPASVVKQGKFFALKKHRGYGGPDDGNHISRMDILLLKRA